MTNISSYMGSGFNTGSLVNKKIDLAQGGDLPAGPFEEDEQRLIHQHKRNPITVNRTKGERQAKRRLISL